MGIRLIAICIFFVFFSRGRRRFAREIQTDLICFLCGSAVGISILGNDDFSGGNFFEAGLEAAELSY